MKNQSFKKQLRYCLLIAALMFSSMLIFTNKTLAQARIVKNIVLVHGALVDASTWEGVYKILTAKGYHVTLVQNPLTSLEDDVAAVNKVLAKQNGPVILVGHSWAGAVITEAGVSPKVAGLVYVAAFQPDAGESAFKQFTSAPAAPQNCLLPPDSAGFIYGDKAKFRAGFAADVPAGKVAFMYASQIPVAVKALAAPLTNAAWKTKPSWGIVPTADKSINPVIERAAYKRSGAKVTEIQGASHCVYISHAAEVAKVIEDAAQNSIKQ
jgi:pimeloyl-ACP methyl ester carboxylesterase